MKKMIRNLFILAALGASVTIAAQQKPAKWDLKNCIEYAHQNNIKVQKAKIAVEESKVDLKQSKAAYLPSLTASMSQNLDNAKSVTSNSFNSSMKGSYSLSSNMTLYNGGKIADDIRQKSLQTTIQELTLKETKNDIEVSIAQAYLQVLYANETEKTDQQTLETSAAQLKRSKNLLDAGSITKIDYAQVESQYSTDKYQLAVDQNTLDEAKLSLKQLLELGINDDFQVEIPALTDEQVLEVLPTKYDVYQTALKVMPQIRNSQLSIDVAGLTYSKAKAGSLPTISLGGSLGTGNIYNRSTSFGTQLGNNFGQNLGVSVSLPIFNNRQTKSAIEKAKMEIDAAKLDYTSAQKDLLKTIESVYQDVVSAQSKYVAAKDQLKSTELSYKLTEEQFNLGMKNTVDLLTQKNKYLSAQQAYLQAKYTAVLNLKLLNFYQGTSISL
ncbi:TolC family protein [Parabacteroides sp. FAFU027]|uniref:TolC family protein n=1 Tax=Parabacteroides sp. FAFU027 TaxID=2922715 RepID=UPI001FAF50B6|nr:TolC family protein [Parabacteroides sp. FAFU027]